MALYKFTASILAGDTIDLYNYGKMRRDFTYIDDIVQGVIRAGDRIAQPNPQWRGDAPDPGTSSAPYRIYNIGNHKPVELSHFIGVLEDALGKKAKLNPCEMQPGDVPATYADVADLMHDVGFEPKTPIEEGIPKFVSWFRQYHRV